MSDAMEKLRALHAQSYDRKPVIAEQEVKRRLACQRQDEAALRLMFPGHFAFYEMVAGVCIA